jgi:hypothetical protein
MLEMLDVSKGNDDDIWVAFCYNNIAVGTVLVTF